MLSEEDALRIEYEHLQDTIWQRTQVTWLVESILITGSLIVAFQSEVKNFLTSFLPLVLVVASFIFLATTDKVDGTNHRRKREIERTLGICGPNRMFESEIEGKWWWVIRRNSWYGLFSVLASSYLFLLTKRLGFSILMVIICFIVILAKESHNWVERRIRRSNANNNG